MHPAPTDRRVRSNSAPRSGVDPSSPTAAFEQRIWREILRRWDDEVKPAAIAKHRALADVDLASLTDEELRSHLHVCIEHLGAMWFQHHRFNAAAMLPVGDFILHAMQWTGQDPVPMFAVFDGWSPVSGIVPPELAPVIDAVNADPAVAGPARPATRRPRSEWLSSVLASRRSTSTCRAPDSGSPPDSTSPIPRSANARTWCSTASGAASTTTPDAAGAPRGGGGSGVARGRARRRACRLRRPPCGGPTRVPTPRRARPLQRRRGRRAPATGPDRTRSADVRRRAHQLHVRHPRPRARTRSTRSSTAPRPRPPTNSRPGLPPVSRSARRAHPGCSVRLLPHRHRSMPSHRRSAG